VFLFRNCDFLLLHLPDDTPSAEQATVPPGEAGTESNEGLLIAVGTKYREDESTFHLCHLRRVFI
jgi:hypothetical protein